MTKWERRQYFERLVQLRALYRLRGADDSTVAISIEDAVELVEDEMAKTIVGTEPERFHAPSEDVSRR
jgi:hypothetical protein